MVVANSFADTPQRVAEIISGIRFACIGPEEPSQLYPPVCGACVQEKVGEERLC
jgi:hypothetical protein